MLGVHHFDRLVLLRVAARVLRWLLSLSGLHSQHVVLPTVCGSVRAVYILWVRRSLVWLVEAVSWAQCWRLVHQAHLVLHLLDVNRVHVHIAGGVVGKLGIVQVVHVARGGPYVELLLVLILAVGTPVRPSSSRPKGILVPSVLLLDLHVSVFVLLARGWAVDDGVAHRLCVPGRLGVCSSHCPVGMWK